MALALVLIFPVAVAVAVTFIVVPAPIIFISAMVIPLIAPASLEVIIAIDPDKVDLAITGVVLRAVLGPLFGVPWRNVQI